MISACDPIWRRTSNIAIQTSSFPDCAYFAITGIKELTVNEHWRKNGRVVGDTPYSMYEISINEYGNAEVELHGVGFSPQPESAKGVDNILSKLTMAVAKSCNHS